MIHDAQSCKYHLENLEMSVWQNYNLKEREIYVIFSRTLEFDKNLWICICSFLFLWLRLIISAAIFWITNTCQSSGYGGAGGGGNAFVTNSCEEFRRYMTVNPTGSIRSVEKVQGHCYTPFTKNLGINTSCK